MIGSFAVTAHTDANSFYSVLLRPGTFDVTASAFGYVQQTASGVVINQDQTTVQNFALARAVPFHPVSGHVRDSSGAPVANATVAILNTPIPLAITAAAGFYRFANVPEGRYTVQVQGSGRCLAP